MMARSLIPIRKRVVGLAAPDSSLNRVFILGQTSAQAGTNNYTIQSFDEKALHPCVFNHSLESSGHPY